MQLTLINFFKKTVPGHVFRGKRRLVKKVTTKALTDLTHQFELQQRNMFFLRHPYLTEEQSHGHVKEFQKTQKKIEFWNSNPLKPPFRPHVKIEDRLIHLRVKESWE